MSQQNPSQLPEDTHDSRILMGQVKREASAIDPLTMLSVAPDQLIIDTPTQTNPQNVPRLPTIDVVDAMAVPIDTNSISSNYSGLQTLVRNYCWKEALALTSKLVDDKGLEADSKLSPISKIKLEAMFRLKMFDELSIEVSNILNREVAKLTSTLETFFESSEISHLGLSTLKHQEYICPITHEIMRDPVLDPEGISYERSAVEEWVLKHGSSPFTRNKLSLADLRPNDNLRLAIESFILQSTASELRKEEEEVGHDCDLYFATTLLSSELKILTGAADMGFEKLYEFKRGIMSACNRPPDSHHIKNLEFWLWRVSCVIANAAVKRHRWRVALSELMVMESGLSAALSDLSLSIRASTLLGRARFEVLCRLCQTLLQVGGVDSCETYFHLSREQLVRLVGPSGLDTSNQASSMGFNEEYLLASEFSDLYEHLTLVRGLLHFGKDEFQEAYDIFRKMIYSEQFRSQHVTLSARGSEFLPLPSNTPELAEDERLATMVCRAIFISSDPSSLSFLGPATNNYAICAIFLKRVSEALQQLELLIQEDPASFLNDPVVFNLCMLYELSCAPDLAANKKKMIHKVASSYHIQDPILNARAFRLDK